MMWTVGQVLPPLVKPPLSREQLAEYAEASGDKNPLHLDDAVAQAAGFPSVICHGMISMAFLADYARMIFPEGSYRVVRLKSRFRKVAFPGDQLTCEGKIKTISPEGVIALSMLAKNQRGEVVTEGEAEVVSSES